MTRSSQFGIDEQFLNRWSPRAYNGADIPEATLFKILEAASFAPSAYNVQPWRFIFARRNTPQWDALLGLLNEFNQSWAKEASALVVIVSKTTTVPQGQTEAVPFATHTFDTGAAWGLLALQASNAGWPAHGMAGFDKDKARTVLGIPDDYAVEIIASIGQSADKAILPAALQEREAPSPRLALNQLAFEGKFKA